MLLSIKNVQYITTVVLLNDSDSEAPRRSTVEPTQATEELQDNCCVLVNASLAYYQITCGIN